MVAHLNPQKAYSYLTCHDSCTNKEKIEPPPLEYDEEVPEGGFFSIKELSLVPCQIDLELHLSHQDPSIVMPPKKTSRKSLGHDFATLDFSDVVYQPSNL